MGASFQSIPKRQTVRGLLAGLLGGVGLLALGAPQTRGGRLLGILAGGPWGAYWGARRAAGALRGARLAAGRGCRRGPPTQSLRPCRRRPAAAVDITQHGVARMVHLLMKAP